VGQPITKQCLILLC